MASKREMNILVTTSNEFSKYVPVLMQSIYDNHPETSVNLYLMNSGFSKTVKKTLSDFVTKRGQKVEFIEINPAMFKGFLTNFCFGVEVYYYMICHEFLPKDMKRILYIDVDTVVNDDIYDGLYNLDFDDNALIAACHNINVEAAMNEARNNPDIEKAAAGQYFNAGVVLFNLEYLRNSDFNYKRLVELKDEVDKKAKTSAFDQSILNYAFFDKTKFVSKLDYNFAWSFLYSDAAKQVTNKKKAILHYTYPGNCYKPWDVFFEGDFAKYCNGEFKQWYFFASKEINDMSAVWWKYAKKTEFYDMLHNELEIKMEWLDRGIGKILIHNNQIMKEYAQLKEKIQVQNESINKTLSDMMVEIQDKFNTNYNTIKVFGANVANGIFDYDKANKYCVLPNLATISLLSVGATKVGFDIFKEDLTCSGNFTNLFLADFNKTYKDYLAGQKANYLFLDLRAIMSPLFRVTKPDKTASYVTSSGLIENDYKKAISKQKGYSVAVVSAINLDDVTLNALVFNMAEVLKSNYKAKQVIINRAFRTSACICKNGEIKELNNKAEASFINKVASLLKRHMQGCYDIEFPEGTLSEESKDGTINFNNICAIYNKYVLRSIDIITSNSINKDKQLLELREEYEDAFTAMRAQSRLVNSLLR